MKKQKKCPICLSVFGDQRNELSQNVALDQASKIADFSPFCSENCRSKDLGNWLFGNYRIPVSDMSTLAEEMMSALDEECPDEEYDEDTEM